MSSSTWGIVASVLVALMFLLAGVTKLARQELWKVESANMGVAWVVARPVPYVETIIGGLLIAQVQRHVVAWSAFAMLAAFTLWLLIRIAQGKREPCACFGSLSTRPIGAPHIIRNVVGMALALAAALL